MNAPDVLGEVVAYRAWRTQPASNCWMFGGLLPAASPSPSGLFATGQRAAWPSERHLTAHCLANADHGAVMAPGEDCECGVYGLSTLEAAVDRVLGKPGSTNAEPGTLARRDEVDRGTIVFGEVRLWGRLVEHEKGWRAEHARPSCLYRTWDDEIDGQVVEVAGRYGVPVVQPPHALTAWLLADESAWNDAHRRVWAEQACECGCEAVYHVRRKPPTVGRGRRLSFDDWLNVTYGHGGQV